MSETKRVIDHKTKHQCAAARLKVVSRSPSGITYKCKDCGKLGFLSQEEMHLFETWTAGLEGKGNGQLDKS